VLHPFGDLAESRSPRSSASRSHCSACSTEPIFASWSTTSDGAPPWSGPFIVPIAPATADAMSDIVEVITRAVNVEALKPCSAPTMK
jgi:hypothetical protein